MLTLTDGELRITGHPAYSRVLVSSVDLGHKMKCRGGEMSYWKSWTRARSMVIHPRHILDSQLLARS